MLPALRLACYGRLRTEGPSNLEVGPILVFAVGMVDRETMQIGESSDAIQMGDSEEQICVNCLS
jgi:hypothetical protein